MTVIATAYVLSDGIVFPVRWTEGNREDGVTFEDHIEFVFEFMFSDDELINIVFH